MLPFEKMLIIGLDGATFTVINLLLKEGKLKGFKKLMQEGSYGKLLSTPIPISPSASSNSLKRSKSATAGYFLST